MAIKNSKKGFVFTFLALFLVMVIYLYAQISLDEKTYSLYNDFEEARIAKVDNEIHYFTTSYMNDVMGVSLDATMQALIEESGSNETFLNSYKQNHSTLNALVYEGMTNGSFYGRKIPSIENQTITYLIEEFEKSFNRNSRASFEFTPENIIIFEEQPMYLSVQTSYRVEATMEDDLSSWNFTDTIVLSRPVTEFYDPNHYLDFGLGSNAPKLETTDSRYRANVNWTLDVFNNTINEQLSTVYSDPQYKYTLGNSYLNRLLQSNSGSYKNVVGFWSFDYDEDEEGVYDTSQNVDAGDFEGNTRIIMDFKNSSSIKNDAAYDYSFSQTGVDWSDTNCAFDGCYSFQQDQDTITIEDPGGINYGSANFSISIWFNPQNDTKEDQRIISIGEKGFDGYEILLNSSNNLLSFKTYNNGIHTKNAIFPDEDFNSWNHLVVRKYGDEADFFLNGQELDTNGSVFDTISNPYNAHDFLLGNYAYDNEHTFEGKLDELGIYSRYISDKEISRLYESKQAEDLGYSNSLHGSAANFDGRDDEIAIDTQNNYSNLFQNDFTVETWFIPKNIRGDVINLNDHFVLSYNREVNELYVSDYNNQFSFPVSLSSSHSNLITISYNQTTNLMEVYHNKNKIGESSSWNPTGNGGPLYFGRSYGGAGVSSSFTGIIDEVRLKNTTSSKLDVIKNYYNYKSTAKGCCNYVLPINPEKTNFNTNEYSDKISYSTTVFDGHYFEDEDFNITLYNVTNITSSQEDKPHYNFLVDVCMLRVYDIFSYDEEGNSAQRVNVGDYDGNCRNLIREGIY